MTTRLTPCPVDPLSPAAKYRKELLELAWRHLTYDGAVRLIALNDQSKARVMLREAAKGQSASPIGRAGSALARALSGSERDRRMWRESKGYGF